MSRNQIIFDQIKFALPDIFLGISLLSLIIIRLIFSESISKKIFSQISIIFCLIGIALNFAYSFTNEIFYNRLFFYNKNVYFLKAILMSCFALCCATLNISRAYKEFNSVIYMIIFVVFCSLTLCISANNFLILLLGIEGAILSVWVLLMRNQSNAMRYLVISSIISGIFLYGSSLYYSEFGSLCFSYINDNKNLVFIIGTILILSALLFEIHAAPFHSWVIDIYEKASTTMVMFFDTVFQFFMFFVFAKMIDIFINKHILFYKPFLYFASILSMLIGGVMPIRQKSINKFIAYSSVGHMGFILSVLAIANHAADFKRSIFYIFSYIVSSSCFFFSILVLQKIKPIREFSDLKGIISSAPIIGYSLILSLFSMIGLPPFINFFAKLKIISFLMSKNAWLLLFVSILYSILGFLYTAKVARYLFMPDIESNEELTNKKFYSAVIPLIALILGIFISSQVESSFSEIFI